MITKTNLESGNLDYYQVIILPFSPCLSKLAATAIDTFVRSGGRLMLYGVSGALDENGFPRNINALTTIYDSLNLSPSEPANQVISTDYGLGKITFVPKSSWTGWNTDPGEQEFDVVGLGKIDILGPEFLKIPQHVRSLLDKPSGRVKTSQGVELTLMFNPDNQELLVHLVNYQLFEDGSFLVEQDVEVEALLPSRTTAKQVTIKAPGSEPVFVESRINDQVLSFVVPNLDVYALCIIDLEPSSAPLKPRGRVTSLP